MLYLALGARIAVVFLALCTSLLIAPFDNSGFIALQSYNDSPAQSIARTSATNLDAAIPFLQNLALPFTQWDTIHFLAIAREGYVDEQKFAFLPGVPALLALAGRLPHILGLPQYVCSPTAAVLSVSVLASCLSCLTPLVLYR